MQKSVPLESAEETALLLNRVEVRQASAALLLNRVEVRQASAGFDCGLAPGEGGRAPRR